MSIYQTLKSLGNPMMAAQMVQAQAKARGWLRASFPCIGVLLCLLDSGTLSLDFLVLPQSSKQIPAFVAADAYSNGTSFEVSMVIEEGSHQDII